MLLTYIFTIAYLEFCFAFSSSPSERFARTTNRRIFDPTPLGFDPAVKQYSGYLDDDVADKHLFYWLFESRHDPSTDPLILWLNGGPGGSSLYGLIKEIGPSIIIDDLTLHYNPYAWNSNASIIFIDQPVNVGFSYSSHSVNSTALAAKDLAALLLQFFELHPQYSALPFHIAGESFAGHYLPALASELLNQNPRKINLASMIIANGVVDTLNSLPVILPPVCDGLDYRQLLSDDLCEELRRRIPEGTKRTQRCYDSGYIDDCISAEAFWEDYIFEPVRSTGVNPYDIRRNCSGASVINCLPNTNLITDFFNRRHVMSILGARTLSYEWVNLTVNNDFASTGDGQRNVVKLIPRILEEVPVLIFAGDADFYCNPLGQMAWTTALRWDGAAEYEAAPEVSLRASAPRLVSPRPSTDQVLLSEQKSNHNKVHSLIGTIKSARNLTLIKVVGGGHTVPADRPDAALDILQRWLVGEWWDAN